MDIEDIAIASAEYKPDDRKKRVAAKAELWNYLKEAAVDIFDWEGSFDELAEDITHQTLRILHPYFTLEEIYAIAVDVFATIKMNVPETVYNNMVSQMADMVSNKISNYRWMDDPNHPLYDLLRKG